MANTKVALLRYCKIASGWRRMRIRTIRKGRGWEEQIQSSEPILQKGEYQLRWYTGSRPTHKGVGTDLQEAINAQENQVSKLEAEKAARKAGRKLLPDESSPSRVLLTEARETFIARKKNTRRRAGVPLCKKTIEAYEFIIDEFLEVTKRIYADEISDEDLLDYFKFLRNRGLEERTVSNYYQSLSGRTSEGLFGRKRRLRKTRRFAPQSKIQMAPLRIPAPSTAPPWDTNLGTRHAVALRPNQGRAGRSVGMPMGQLHARDR